MASLVEVQVALKQGNKQKAGQLLKVLIKENPSADAWYLAAKMTSNPEVAKQHLQRALAFDAKHIKARDMLREMGGTPQSFGTTMANGFWPSLRTELEKFGENRPILRQLQPKQRMMTAMTLYGGSLLIIILMLGVVLNPPPPPPLPEITNVTVFEGATLGTYLMNSGLTIVSMESLPAEANALYKEQLNLSIEDAAGSHPVTVYLYDDIGKIVSDGKRLNDLAQQNQLSIYQTAVILYPADMDSATTAALDTAMNAVPADLIAS